MLVPLLITERTVDGVVVLQLSGHLVFDEGGRVLRERVLALIEGGARLLLLDLTNVSYIDSGGIGTLVEMYNHAARRGGTLKLLHPSPCASRVLDITHLVTVFDIFENEPDAIRSMTATHA